MKDLLGVFRGVVENNIDPEKMGRCKIRVFGVHTPHKTKINKGKDGVLIEDLPWATPANSIMGGSISGFGTWAVPVQGSHVFLFFENGHPNQPVYFASVPGKPTQESDPSMGFNDPDGVYPTKHRLDEPDVHRLVRGVSEGTIVEGKNNNLDEDVETADGDSWSEPPSFYETIYPNNVVLATHGGNIIELDSTPGSRRIHIFHSSNSYVEINNDGTMIIKNNKDKYEIVMGNNNIHIKQNKNETIDGNKTFLVSGNETSKVNGSVTRTIGVDNTDNITGNLAINVTGDCDIVVTGQCNITAATVDIDGGGGINSGVVTGQCICAFTGKPHMQSSSDVNASL
jgi:hypothetical protein